MRVLVAPDKFKGSLTAGEVATAIVDGLADVAVEARPLPLADGGDGSVAAAVAAGYRARPVTVRGADGTPVHTELAYGGSTAVVEVASTCGLATLPPGERAAMTASSFGFGEAVRAAVGLGARRVVLALGGSASTDGGAGMLSALGVRFHDSSGAEVHPTGERLRHITGVDTTGLLDLTGVDLVVATDVTNPLLGPVGAAAVFGPQKGATPAQVSILEGGLEHVAGILTASPAPETRPDASTARPGTLAAQPGAGAAGGLGFTCLWLGARRVAGAEFFLDLLRFDAAVEGHDAVVTGEGRIDSQTLAGKLPAAVIARAGHRPTYAVVGRNLLTDDEQRSIGLEHVYALADLDRSDSCGDNELSRRLARLAGRLVGQRLHAAGVDIPT